MKTLRLLSAVTLCLSMILLVACSKEESSDGAANGDGSNNSQPAEGDGEGPTLEGGGDGGMKIGEGEGEG